MSNFSPILPLWLQKTEGYTKNADRGIYTPVRDLYYSFSEKYTDRSAASSLEKAVLPL